MRDGGRVSAAMEILDDFNSRRVPLKVCLSDWARNARFAGSKDRAAISGLALDVLRRRESLYATDGGTRMAVALALRHLWAWPVKRIVDAYADEPHGPGDLDDLELELIEQGIPTPEEKSEQAEVPAFVYDMLARVSDDPVAEGLASCARAATDLRVNTLKADPEKAMKALVTVGVEPSVYAVNGLRVPAPSPDQRAADVTITPAYQKGWVEVQDEGSQIAALAAGRLSEDRQGAQVLDYCAGGGGKSLALAALMDNRGQIFAYDNDARRLAPIFERLTRSNIRNVQVISPAEDVSKLEELVGKMDVVFVDAPCTGSGTWRRRPDTKWRLTEEQLATRMDEQDEVLGLAAQYVKPGGALVYVTCSVFAEENEDRIAAFLSRNEGFTLSDARAAIIQSGGVRADSDLPPLSEGGTLRLSPRLTDTDGFGITRLQRRS
ncbi:RsmB/NOP family class I SAM-dependent RNA methyltransferase [Parvularcula sp. LCG005]|uniref:RsmB/NOP family class I SAM-dependent RNA methyltransferase n=1 Tax=Parvularcula sp. LCG005 TaxID=3078805 RepID=UPI00294286C4|nr:RsmB/NOP family class I SAM-dependent RNA methyltransferase [Parvularcula sp. LCG005]WOI54575.1 RsmB/NOP family class I SAM-dependent RNA methyltransferase [Parvularcula sp. LCG005]